MIQNRYDITKNIEIVHSSLLLCSCVKAKKIQYGNLKTKWKNCLCSPVLEQLQSNFSLENNVVRLRQTITLSKCSTLMLVKNMHKKTKLFFEKKCENDILFIVLGVTIFVV